MYRDTHGVFFKTSEGDEAESATLVSFDGGVEKVILTIGLRQPWLCLRARV